MKTPILITVLIISNLTAIGQDRSINYDHVYPYRDGFSLVVKDEKFGIINSQFTEVIPPILNSINDYDLSDYYFDGILYGVINDSTVYFDTLGNRIRAFDNPDIYPTIFTYRSIDSLVITGAPGSLGVEKEDHSVVIWYGYNSIFTGWNEHIVATKSYFLSNVKNKEYEPSKRVYETIVYNHFGDKLCWVKQNNEWSLVNSEFEKILDDTFEYIYANEHWTAVENKGKFGFVNAQGKQITGLEYEGRWTQYVSDSPIIVAYKEQKPLFLNTEGQCVFNCD